MWQVPQNRMSLVGSIGLIDSKSWKREHVHHDCLLSAILVRGEHKYSPHIILQGYHFAMHSVKAYQWIKKMTPCDTRTTDHVIYNHLCSMAM